jgi:hypothetical protein
MSYNVDDVVLIKRSNGSTSLAKITGKNIFWVPKTDINKLVRPPQQLPVGATVSVKVKDKDQTMYNVQMLNDDLTPTDQGKTIPESHIVASMMPHLRGLKLLKLRNDLPDDIRAKMDKIEIDAMIENAANAPMNVKRLKLLMNKYQEYPEFIKKIREKLNSIILAHYGKYGNFKFHEGAHPEFIMNAFLYDPSKSEKRFKVLRIDGTQVTYHMLNEFNEPSREMTIGLDEFLRMPISAKNAYGWWNIPIGEVYGFFPERDLERGTEDVYNAKVNNYLEHLMKLFANKPHTEFFSVPIAAVPASSFPAASAASSPNRSTALKRNQIDSEPKPEPKPKQLRTGSSASHHDGGSRKNTKSTHKRRICTKSKKSKKSRKSIKSIKSKKH